MKKFKRIMALVIALAMVLGLMSMTAFAEDETSHDDTTQTTPAAAATAGTPRYSTDDSGNLVLDASLKIAGLEANDTVVLYKVVGWNNDWVLTDDFKNDSAAYGYVAANALAAVKAGTISYDLASDWAALASTVYPTTGLTAPATDATLTNGTWEFTNADPGLYMALITSSTPGVVYNPVILGKDYYENQSSFITLTDNGTSYSDNAVAKKQKISLEKSSDSITQTKVDAKDTEGSDKATFYIETLLPKYPADYTNPVFNIHDTLSKGLQLAATSGNIAVYKGLTKAEYLEATDEVKSAALLTATSGYTTTTAGYAAESGDYTLVVSNDAGEDKIDSFDIGFTKKHVTGIAAAEKILVVYEANITGDVPYNVNPEDNTVTIDYSNSPSDSTGAGHLKDKTNHYTFDIDGNLLGNDSWKATELVKVGVDKEGNEITEEVTIHEGMTVGALKGATFTIKKKSATGDTFETYTNSYLAGLTPANVITSDADGRIAIKGLAADVKLADESGQHHYQGIYELEETAAPDGYIKDGTKRYIVIDAYTEDITTSEDGYGEYTVETLVHYTVKVGEGSYDDADLKVTGDYTIDRSGATGAAAVATTATSAGDTYIGSFTNDNKGKIIGDDSDEDQAAESLGKIRNVQGVELPSTGGIGTTIFYTIGGILVIGAGVILITRRRMDA